MGRGQGGIGAAGGSSSGGQLPNARPQITLTTAARDLIEARLEDLPLDRDALKLAMAQFGPNFVPGCI
ncbi:MAG: hypothetical protein ACLP01_10060 [Solirubrobacteraceae bacterium]